MIPVPPAARDRNRGARAAPARSSSRRGHRLPFGPGKSLAGGPTGSEVNVGRSRVAPKLPPAIAAELRRLLTCLLVEDLRAYPNLPDGDRDGQIPVKSSP
jgi:hypothetical protein